MRKAIVSVFFEKGDTSSSFLTSIGFDPENNPEVSNLL
jgi:hypothetical protein